MGTGKMTGMDTITSAESSYTHRIMLIMMATITQRVAT